MQTRYKTYVVDDVNSESLNIGSIAQPAERVNKYFSGARKKLTDSIKVGLIEV